MNDLTPIYGGKDPDGMNERREHWGWELASRLMYRTGTDREDAVCDAICNLLHHAVALGQDPAEELARAVSHFNAETGEG